MRALDARATKRVPGKVERGGRRRSCLTLKQRAAAASSRSRACFFSWVPSLQARGHRWPVRRARRILSLGSAGGGGARGCQAGSRDSRHSPRVRTSLPPQPCPSFQQPRARAAPEARESPRRGRAPCQGVRSAWCRAPARRQVWMVRRAPGLRQLHVDAVGSIAPEPASRTSPSCSYALASLPGWLARDPDGKAGGKAEERRCG